MWYYNITTFSWIAQKTIKFVRIAVFPRDAGIYLARNPFSHILFLPFIPPGVRKEKKTGRLTCV